MLTRFESLFGIDKPDVARKIPLSSHGVSIVHLSMLLSQSQIAVKLDALGPSHRLLNTSVWYCAYAFCYWWTEELPVCNWCIVIYIPEQEIKTSYCTRNKAMKLEGKLEVSSKIFINVLMNDYLPAEWSLYWTCTIALVCNVTATNFLYEWYSLFRPYTT